MDTLFVSKDCKISRRDNTLLIIPNKGPKSRIPIHGLRHIVVAGEAGITTSLLALLGQHGVRLTVLDWHGNLAGHYEPHNQIACGAVHLAQARHVSNPALRLDVAKLLIKGAANNLLINLRQRRNQGRPQLQPTITAIEGLSECAATATTIEALMGYEGNMRGWYYDAWPLIDARLTFGARTRRPPNNPINCLMSWYNGLVYAACRQEISKTHLDGCLSFLHSPHAARSSLALDLAEVFKPALTDLLIQDTMLRKEDTSSWFDTKTTGVCLLTPAGRRASLEKWITRLDTPKADGSSYRQTIRAEALALERHVLEICTYKPWKRSI